MYKLLGLKPVLYFKTLLNTRSHVFNFFFRWQPECKFTYELVRLPPRITSESKIFTENQEVEVHSKANDQESCGWWRAIVKASNLLDISMKQKYI